MRKLPVNVLFMLSRIRALSFKFMEHELSVKGLSEISPADGDVLYVIHKNQPIEMKEISRLTRKDKSTITGVIKELEKKGYVQRKRSIQDMRKIQVSMTPAATSLGPELFAISRKYQKRLLKGFDLDERKKLSEFLERLHDNME